MTSPQLSAPEREQVAELVDHFRDNLSVFETFLSQIMGIVENAALRPYTHTLKARIKNPEHLRDKLSRKMAKASAGEGTFDLTKENLFERINDLVGVRLLHLHSRQIADIHPILMNLFDDSRIQVREASARTWDLESTAFYQSLGIATVASPSYYTSVHYIVDPMAKTTRTAEIQVRTLAEEIWGEVDHLFNYPYDSASLPCREQIKALARVTSSCSRLVDSIFATQADFDGGLAEKGQPAQTIEHLREA